MNNLRTLPTPEKRQIAVTTVATPRMVSMLLRVLERASNNTDLYRRFEGDELRQRRYYKELARTAFNAEYVAAVSVSRFNPLMPELHSHKSFALYDWEKYDTDLWDEKVPPQTADIQPLIHEIDEIDVNVFRFAKGVVDPTDPRGTALVV